MKRLFIIVLAVLLVGCELPDIPTEAATADAPTLTASPEPSFTASPTSEVVIITPSETATMDPTATATPSPTPTVPVVSGNLLLCSGFECGDHLQRDQWGNLDGALRVADAWLVGWGSVPDRYGNNLSHECSTFKAHTEREFHATHVREGGASQRLIQAYAACSAWAYQTVDVSPGALYAAEGWALNWSTSSPQVDTPSTGDMASWICLDPAGGTNPFAAGVVCGDPWWNSKQLAAGKRDVFGRVATQARAGGLKMTLFLLSIPNFALARSDAFWDAVRLEAVNEAPTATPSPLPTPTQIATSGPIVEIPPTEVPYGLGVVQYSVLTNLRDCSHAQIDAGWPGSFDPQVSCSLVLHDGVASTLTPGSFARVWDWGRDRYGNIWAWFDAIGTYTAVACYKGAPRGWFYPGIDTGTFAGLIDSGAPLPAAVNVCTVK